MLSVVDPFQNIVPGFYCSTGPFHISFILILHVHVSGVSIGFMNSHVSPYQMLVCIARQPILVSFGITCTMIIISVIVNAIYIIIYI